MHLWGLGEPTSGTIWTQHIIVLNQNQKSEINKIMDGLAFVFDGRNFY